MSTTSMVISSNPLFATYSVYARDASISKLTFYGQSNYTTVTQYATIRNIWNGTMFGDLDWPL